MVKVNIKQVVDKGVPVPVRTVSPLHALEVGDSLLLPNTERIKTAQQASTIKRRSGKEFTLRKVDNNNFRVWRTK